VLQRPSRVSAGCSQTTATAVLLPGKQHCLSSRASLRQWQRQPVACSALDTQSNGAAGAVEQPPPSGNGSSSSNGEHGSSSCGSSSAATASFVSSSGSYDTSDAAAISTLIAESEATESGAADGSSSSSSSGSSSPGAAVLACEDAALSPSDSADDLCAVDELDTPEGLTDLNYSGRNGPAPDLRRVNFTLGTWAEDEDPFSSWWKNRCGEV
jgi:hypothetical protein